MLDSGRGGGRGEEEAEQEADDGLPARRPMYRQAANTTAPRIRHQRNRDGHERITSVRCGAARRGGDAAAGVVGFGGTSGEQAGMRRASSRAPGAHRRAVAFGNIGLDEAHQSPHRGFDASADQDSTRSGWPRRWGIRRGHGRRYRRPMSRRARAADAGRLAVAAAGALLAPDSGAQHGERDHDSEERDKGQADQRGAIARRVRRRAGRRQYVTGRVQDVPTKVMPSLTSSRYGWMPTNGCALLLLERGLTPDKLGAADRRRPEDGRAVDQRPGPVPQAPLRDGRPSGRG